MVLLLAVRITEASSLENMRYGPPFYFGATKAEVK
jgi:hypothetical protein